MWRRHIVGGTSLKTQMADIGHSSHVPEVRYNVSSLASGTEVPISVNKPDVAIAGGDVRLRSTGQEQVG